jgi:hypothetical protein
MKKHYHVSYIECEGSQYAHPVSFIVRSAKTASTQRKSAKITECTCLDGQPDLRRSGDTAWRG